MAKERGRPEGAACARSRELEEGRLAEIVGDLLIGRGNGARLREVGVGDVLPKHAMRVEEGSVDRNAVLADTREGFLVGVERGDDGLELGVELLSLLRLIVEVVDGPAGRCSRRSLRSTSRPARRARERR